MDSHWALRLAAMGRDCFWTVEPFTRDLEASKCVHEDGPQAEVGRYQDDLPAFLAMDGTGSVQVFANRRGHYCTPCHTSTPPLKAGGNTCLASLSLERLCAKML